MGDRLRALIRWLASLHAPLGHWAPIATSLLFAGAGLAGPGLLRALAYCAACIFALLIAADLAKVFIDQHPYPFHHATVLTVPMLGVRIMISAVLGSVYSFLVFMGVGPWTPYILWPIIFFICCFIAWRNVDLWYEEGAEFEAALAEEARHHGDKTLPHAHERTHVDPIM